MTECSRVPRIPGAAMARTHSSGAATLTVFKGVLFLLIYGVVAHASVRLCLKSLKAE